MAVHGINGDRQRTWSSNTSKVCWLNHPDLLPSYIKNSRVLTWGYNANVTSYKGRSTSADRIMQHAQTLIAQLQADREVGLFTVEACHYFNNLLEANKNLARGRNRQTDYFRLPFTGRHHRQTGKAFSLQSFKAYGMLHHELSLICAFCRP